MQVFGCRGIIGRFSLLLLPLFIVGFSGAFGLYGQEVGILSSSGDGVPTYVTRVSEQLLAREAEKLLGGTAVSTAALRQRLESNPDLADLADCTEADCAARIARETGLGGVLLFNLARSGAGYTLQLKAVRADGELLGPVQEQVFDIRDLDEGVASVGQALAIQAGLIEPPVEASPAPAAVAEASSGGLSPENQEAPAAAEESPATGADPADQDQAKASSTDEPQPAENRTAEESPETTHEAVFSLPGQSPARHIAFTAGLGLLQLGGIGNLLTLMSDSEAASSDYKSGIAVSPADRESYHSAYETYGFTSRVAGIGSWGLHAAVPFAAGYALFGGDPEGLGYSRKGRRYLYTGLGSAIAGHLLYLWSIDPLVESSYLRARADADPLVADYYRNEYNREFPWVVVRETATVGLWAVGTAYIMSAPLQDGEPEPLAANFWDKVLVSSGMAFFTGGNVLAAVAGMKRTDTLEAWYDYLNATTDVQAKYDSMVEERGNFELARNISAGLWIAGAACLAAAEFFDFPDPGFVSRNSRDRAAAEKASPLRAVRLLPRPDGGSLFVHLDF